MFSLKFVLRLLCAASVASIGGSPVVFAQASAYPNKAIRMVVPYPPGGPTDLTARVVAAEMSKTLGQSIIVDNKPGASGMIGAEMVARAEPDGYTFLANASLHVINPHLYPEMRFDALKDFVPITQLAAVPLVLVVPNSLPVHSIKDLVEYGKKIRANLILLRLVAPRHSTWRVNRLRSRQALRCSTSLTKVVHLLWLI